MFWKTFLAPLVQKIVEQFLKNLLDQLNNGGLFPTTPPASGVVLPLTTGASQADVDAAIAKTVDDLLH